MCVRYTLHKTDAALGAISRAVGVLLETPVWAQPRYNVTLTDMMPAVGVRPMRCGIVSDGDRVGARLRFLANAKSETAAALSAFRKGVAARRCLVPANGFYEWASRAGVKRPCLFTLAGEEPFAFADIWDPATDDLPETYCLLTTPPNELVAQVHDRMPAILTAETMRRWLGDRPLPEEEYSALVAPIAFGRMESRPVSRYVSNSRNQGPQCLAPPDDPPEAEFDFG
jgi:putative SOS response-associated peptidase YedK